MAADRDIQRGGRRDRREDVGDIGPPDQPRLDVHAALRRARVELEAVEGQRQGARRDIGRLVDRVGHRTVSAAFLSDSPRGSSRLMTPGAPGGSISNNRRFAAKYDSMSP